MMKTVTVSIGSVDFEREMDESQIGALIIMLSELDEPKQEIKRYVVPTQSV